MGSAETTNLALHPRSGLTGQRLFWASGISEQSWHEVGVSDAVCSLVARVNFALGMGLDARLVIFLTDFGSCN